MRIMSGGRTAAGIAVLTALTLGLTACGGEKDQNAAGGDLANECRMVGGSAVAVPGAVQVYLYSGNEADLSVSESDYASLIKDPELSELQKKLDESNREFNAATDDEARTKILNEQKTEYEEYLSLCESSMTDDDKSLFGRFANDYPTKVETKVTPKSEGPTKSTDAEPTSKAPQPAKITPVGTTVKVGEPVTLEFTDGQGNKGPIKFTITKIETGKPDDLKYIKEESRDQIKQMVYVRGKAEYAEKLNSDNALTRPRIEDLDPEYEVTTNDGSRPGFLMGMGDFKPCENSKPDVKDVEPVLTFCTPLPMATSGTKVTAVEVDKLRFDQDEQPLYTWTN